MMNASLPHVYADLKGEGLVEHRTEVLALHFGLKLLLFVWQHIDFDVWIRGPAHVHGCEVLSLKDPDYQLGKNGRIS